MVFMETMKLTMTISVICAFFCAITVACSFSMSRESEVQVKDSDEIPHSSNDQTANERRKYEEAIATIGAERDALASEYRQANTQAKKNAALDRARNVITQSIANGLFPFWYG